MADQSPSTSLPSREIEVHTGFTPRKYQAGFMRYLERGGKRAVWVVHRRGGKDLTALHQTCRMAHRRPGLYWHVFPTFSQGRKSVWEGFTKDGRRILDMAFPRELVKSRGDGEMKIEFKNGSIWRLMGSDKIEVVGAGPYGVVFSEFAVARPNAWELVRPMLRENGGWAAFITTPRGRNHAWELYDQATRESGWFRALMTVDDTSLEYESSRTPGLMLTPKGMMDEERAEGMPEALIRQEYLCDWTAANVGSVWGDLVEGLERSSRVCAFEAPQDGVFTSWDIGFTDATAIWFWRLNDKRCVDLIDHYEAHGKSAEHYMAVVESKPYVYVKHWLPHDARAKTFASGVSAIERLLGRWPGRVAIAPALSIIDGIQAGRWLLQQPMRIHARCGEGIEALRQYHYQYDEDTKAFSVKPEHDWSSHTADAFRYLACVVKHSELITRPEVKPPQPKVGPADRAWNLDQLFEDNEQDRSGRRRI